MADIESAVIVVTTVVVNIKIVPSMIPAWPTTQLNRKNNMTPHMFRMHLIITPCIHPNFMPPSVSGSPPIGTFICYILRENTNQTIFDENFGFFFSLSINSSWSGAHNRICQLCVICSCGCVSYFIISLILTTSF